MEYHSAMKRNEIGSFVKMWMDPETVLQSEVRKKGQQLLTIKLVRTEKYISHFRKNKVHVGNMNFCFCFPSFFIKAEYFLTVNEI